MKEPDPPDSDDDGWGDAASAASPPASEAAVDNEWDDPADLEKRVAALREQREAEAASGAEPASPAESSVVVEQLGSAPDVPVETKEAPGETTEAQAETATVPPPDTVESAVSSVAADLGATSPSVDPAKTKKAGGDKKKHKKPGEAAHSLTPRQKKFIGGGSAALIAAAVLAILGWFNSQNYYLTCGTETISAEQGNFWPWGASPLPGPAYRPIRVPSDVLCTNQHFESRVLLEDAFLDALLKQSTALLTSGNPDQVGTAEAQLEQALLLTRGPERSAERTLAQRLQGDVSYWRGAAQAQAAAELLRESADHFKEAAAKRPRHTSDANSWAEHARAIKTEIDKGPPSLRKDEAPKDQPQFLGLTPTRARSTDVKQESPDQDAGVPAAIAPQEIAPPDAAVPPADAALPKGGVLL